MLQISKIFSLSLHQLFIYQDQMNGDGRGGIAEALHSFVATTVGSKSKTIHLRDFKDVDLNFTHFANFKFAYFEIELNF